MIARENRRPARLYPQAIRDTDTKSATSGQAKNLDDLIQTPCHPRPWFNKRSQALRKDFPNAGRDLTKELAHTHEQAHVLSCTG